MEENKDFSKKEIQKLNRLTAKGVRGSFAKDSDSFQTDLEIASASFKRSAADMMTLGGVPESTRIPLLYVDPMFDPILLMFPKENIKELNRRLRHYYTYHPIVRNVCDLHSEFPLSDFELRCNDKGVELYYNELKEKIRLLQLMVNLNRDYWVLGESFAYGNWDETNLEWINFNQYPPENIDVYRTYVGPGVVYYLKADEELKRIINSPREVDRAIANLIPAEFREHVRQGKPYLLANERLIHFARRPSAYSLRGESILKSVLKDLLYEDKLRLLQYTFVDRHTFPIKLWKIGSKEKGWIPSKKHFQAFELQLAQAMNDPDYNIITHPYVEANFLTTVDKKENLIPQFEFVHKRIMAGLFANDAMLHGEASPYAAQAVSMRVVMHRYLTNRTLLENLIREKIFLPVAIARGFIERTEAELSHKVRISQKYILPKFFYTQRLNLLSSTVEQEMLLRLRDKGEIPMEIICDVFGWDPENLKKAFQKEHSTELDPLWRKSREEVSKDPKVRNQILDGTKTADLTIFEKVVTEEPKVGRPPKPEEEKYKPIPAIISPGEGEHSPRFKQQERGVIPKPLGEELKEPKI